MNGRIVADRRLTCKCDRLRAVNDSEWNELLHVTAKCLLTVKLLNL